MRLSRKGFNNILIFGILIIIFLFNFKHKLTFTPAIKQQSIIDNQQLIVELKTPDMKLTRVGQNWQSTPNLGLSTHQLATLVNNWQQMPLPTHQAPLQTENAYTIQVYVADKTQPLIVQLFQHQDGYLLQRPEQTTLFLSEQQLPLLLGR